MGAPDDVVKVFLFALLTALATGLGALPFLFAKHATRSWLGVSNALASGLMLAASFGLVYEGVAYGLGRTLLGVVLGLGFVVLTRALLQHEEHPAVFASMGGFDARKALLIVGVMTLHSFTEGVGVGVSFGGWHGLGLFITLAIAVHNIPEGLAISLVLVPRGGGGRGGSVERFLQPAAALDGRPGLPFRGAFRAFAADWARVCGGAMMWMVFSELVPDALEETRSNIVAAVITLAVAAMVAFQFLIR